MVALSPSRCVRTELPFHTLVLYHASHYEEGEHEKRLGDIRVSICITD